MPSAHPRRRLEAPALRSLAFAGDDLVDWLGGWRVTPDGAAHRFGTGHTYRFDDALGHGPHGVLFERRGTKGILVRTNGTPATPSFVPMGVDLLRELDRSFYTAEAYGFPLALFDLPDGRPAIAHCPRGYDRIDLELLDGTLLTARDCEHDDVFHSRLQASPDGRWLLSNGWVWHPWNTLQVYDVQRALSDPAHLSGAGVLPDLGDDWEWEVEAATFVGERVVYATSSEAAVMGVAPLDGRAAPRIMHLTEPPGTRLMAWGPDHVVALDGAPRVIALDTGEVMHRWTDLDGGPGVYQPGYGAAAPAPPWVAVDRAGARFAIAAPGEGETWHIDVVQRAE